MFRSNYALSLIALSNMEGNHLEKNRAGAYTNCKIQIMGLKY